MPRPIPTESYVAHLSRLPRSLDADMRRIADAEDIPFAELERMWLSSMVVLYDNGGVRAEGV